MSESKLERAIDTIEKLRIVLETYGDADRYTTMETASCGLTIADDDAGELARDALAVLDKDLHLIATAGDDHG